MSENKKVTENTENTNVTENVETEAQANGMDVAANPAQEHVAENAIATTSGTALIPVKQGAAYITNILKGIMDAFIAANDGLDMDFVYMGSWLVIDKKGNFAFFSII